MNGKQYEYRTEQITIKRSHPMFNTIDELAFKAKNVYNSGVYIERQCFFQYSKFISYDTLEAKHKVEYPTDYQALPAQTTQQILMKVAKDCKSFTQASKKFKQNPSDFTGEPNIPNYKHKTKGRSTLYFTNQQVRIKDNILVFPAEVEITGIKTRLNIPTIVSNAGRKSEDFSEIRIVKNNNSYNIELIYSKLIGPQVDPTKDLGIMGSKVYKPKPSKNSKNPKTPRKQTLLIPQLYKIQTTNYTAGLDIGTDNFATIATYGPNIRPLIINGKGLKSYNKNFNKKLAHYKSIAMQRNNKFTTQRIQNLYDARSRHFMDYYHKASKAVIDYLLQNGIKTLVIGYNKGWKQKSPLSKQVNQTFIQIGHKTFIKQVIYKARNYDIQVILNEESHTSGTSFIDDELPTRTNYDIARRIHRGCFKSNQGYFINADVNAAFQIIKKVYPAATFQKVRQFLKLAPTRITPNKTTKHKSIWA